MNIEPKEKEYLQEDFFVEMNHNLSLVLHMTMKFLITVII